MKFYPICLIISVCTVKVKLSPVYFSYNYKKKRVFSIVECSIIVNITKSDRWYIYAGMVCYVNLLSVYVCDIVVSLNCYCLFCYFT